MINDLNRSNHNLNPLKSGKSIHNSIHYYPSPEDDMSGFDSPNKPRVMTGGHDEVTPKFTRHNTRHTRPDESVN